MKEMCDQLNNDPFKEEETTKQQQQRSMSMFVGSERGQAATVLHPRAQHKQPHALYPGVLPRTLKVVPLGFGAPF